MEHEKSLQTTSQEPFMKQRHSISVSEENLTIRCVFDQSGRAYYNIPCVSDQSGRS